MIQNERSPILVLGTGRCGSTLISEMVCDHPDALSISELFSFVTDLGMEIERPFPAGTLSGAQFWSILATARPRQSMLLRHGLKMPEVIYPFEDGPASASDLPPILQAMLPHLEPAEPDQLFRDLADVVCAQPSQSIGDHYRDLFGYLQRRFRRALWVERSGGSLRIAKRLLATFPEAKVLHIVRDGRDTALSMSRHIGFRMALLCGLQVEQLGLDPFGSDDRSEEEDLPDELAALLPENFSASAFHALDLPAALCGHYWSGEIICGLEVLSGVPSDRLLTLRYEDIVTDTRRSVECLGSFVGGDDSPDWVDRAVARVEDRSGSWRSLSEETAGQLAAACEPGMRALREWLLVNEPALVG